MKDKDYEEMVRRAKDAVSSLEEPFRSIAFREILTDQMRDTRESVQIATDAGTRVVEQSAGKGGFLQSHGIQTLNQLDRILKPGSHVDKVLMIAYFLKDARNLSAFQTKDLEDSYQEALIRPSSNTSQMINENKKKGFFMDIKGEDGKPWKSITTEGIDEIKARIAEALKGKE